MLDYKRLGISITTHSNQYTQSHRYAMIGNCFETLAKLSPRLIVNIISDGITERHRKIINGYPQFNHIERESNGGVARAKNTSIRTLLEQNVDIGFLADDDLIFKSEYIFTAYATAILKTGIPHFCFCQNYTPLLRRENGFQIRQLGFVMGAFMTFTPYLIEKIGYFRVFNYKYGHEHSNFSLRCRKQGHIPYFCDIINPTDLIIMDHRSMMGDVGKSIQVDWEQCEQNEIESSTQLDNYFPNIE